MEKFNRAVIDPSSVYDTPFDITSDDTLSFEQKIALLKNWAWDTRELLVAEDENMEGSDGEAGELLENIQDALRQLQNK